MHFKRIILLFILLHIYCLGKSEEAANYDALYNVLKNYPSQELVEEGWNHMGKGWSHMKGAAADTALICYTIVSNRYIPSLSQEEKERCARAFNNCGYIYFFYYFNYPKAYSNCLKTLEICEAINYEALLPSVYINIANIFNNFNDYDQARQYYEKSYDKSLEIESWDYLSTAFINLASLSFLNDQLDQMEDKLHAFPSLPIPQENCYAFELETCRGMIHALNKEYGLALENFKRSEEYAPGCKLSPRYLYSAYLNQAKTHTLMNRYDLAIGCIKKGEAVGIENGYQDMMTDAVRILADYYGITGNKEMALEYKSRYLHMSDSVYNAREYTQIKDMQSLYEVEKIETKVNQLTAEQLLKNRILIIVSGALIIIALLLVLAYRQNRRLTERNKDLFKKNVEVMQSEEKEKRMRKEYEAKLQEYERQLQEVGTESKIRHKKELSDEHKSSLLKSIMDVMNNNDEIYSFDFSLDRLATLAESNSAYVSKTINDQQGKNFNTFLSEYRISEARKRLIDFEQYGNLTIEAIAVDLGFKSRSNFVHVFKKVTGLTPTEYQRMAKRMRS